MVENLGDRPGWIKGGELYNPPPKKRRQRVKYPQEEGGFSNISLTHQPQGKKTV